MKKNTFLKIGFICLFIFQTLYVLNACKKKPFDDLKVNIDTDVFVSPMIIEFENANSKSTTPLPDFTITIEGKDASKILSSIGTKTYSVYDGWISLNLAQGTSPSASNPIQFTLKVKASTNFEALNKEISIENTDELKLKIRLIEKNALPEGVKEKINVITTTNGKLTTPLIVTTDKSTDSKQSVELKIETGTEFKDKDGITIKEPLTSTIRFFDVSDESISIFPGGLTPQKVKDKDGKDIEGGVTFFTAGLVQVNMKSADGNEVKNFSKPVSAEIRLNPDQDNFKTGVPVKEKDSIPLWSYDETTMVWSENPKQAYVVKNDDGTLSAKFDMNHLSCWNLDWGWSMFGGLGTSKNKLDVVFNTDWANASGNYEITMRSPNGGYLAALHGASIFNGYVATFTSTPDIPLVFLEIRDNATGKKTITEKFNPSTKGKITINIKDEIVDMVNISLKYDIKCTSNPKISPNSSTWIVITDIETGKKIKLYTGITNNKKTKGALNLRLQNKKNYKISTTGSDGKIISCEAFLDKNKLESKNIKGLEITKLFYNATSNTIEIECIYTTSKC